MRKASLFCMRLRRPLIRLSYRDSSYYRDNATLNIDDEEGGVECQDGGRGNFTCDVAAKVLDLFSAIQRQDQEETEKLLQTNGSNDDDDDDDDDYVNSICNGLTPLHLACHLHNMTILKLLLRYNAKVEVMTKKELTPLHTAITDGWNEGVTALLEHGANPHPSSATPRSFDTPLETAIKSGNDEAVMIIFDHYPNIDPMDCAAGSLLHLAAQSRQPSIVRCLLDEEMSMSMLGFRDDNGDTAMHSALHKGRVKHELTLLEILRLLIEAGMDVNCRNKAGQTPLYLSARRRLLECTELLISLDCDLHSVTESGESVIHGACHGGCAKTLTLLLNTGRLGHLVTAPDNYGKQPFHCAVQSYSIDCCEILLKNGDSLTSTDTDGASRCFLLLQYFPSISTRLITTLLDSYITLSDDPQYDRNFRVIFDYSCILYRNKNGVQSSVLEDMNLFNKELLQHPLVESLVFFKWTKVKGLFYIMLFLYFVFIIIHTMYIISIISECSGLTRHIANMWTFRVLHLAMYIIILWPEIITLIANPTTYFRHWETLTKIISLAASAYVVSVHQHQVDSSDPSYDNPPNNTTNTTLILDPGSSYVNVSDTVSLYNGTYGADSHNATECIPTQSFINRKISAVSVFFGWMELMMLCGRLPILGSNVLMFARIAKSAIKFIAAFIGLLVGFSISFMVLFSNKEEFSTVGRSFVKTLMMMIGEVDYSDLVDDDTEIISYVILVVFLFLVCILMANLLIGLAVDDINTLQRIGSIDRQSKQVTHIVNFEKTITVAKRFRLLPKQLVRALTRLYRVRMQRKIYVNKSWKIWKILEEMSGVSKRVVRTAMIIGQKNHSTTYDTRKETTTRQQSAALLLQKLDELKKIVAEGMENGEEINNFDNNPRKQSIDTVP